MDLDSAILYSNDIEAVVPFYRDIVGFELEYHQSNRFASFIFPNGARLGIKTKTRDRERPGYQTVFISVHDDIESKYEELRKKDLNFFTQLTEYPWGKEFSILDADNNRILFIKR